MNRKNNPIRKIVRVRISLLLYTTIVMLASCAPVNRFTRLKKVPGEYARNYEIGGIKMEQKFLEHATPWIVFSAKDGNMSHNYPGGRIRRKEFGFLEPFFVIKEKGKHIAVVKYSPDLAEGLKLKERKNAKYYGWIRKSDLLLRQESETDVYTGLKNKYIITLTDTAAVNHSSSCLSTDSAYVFADPDLTIRRGGIPVYSIVYLLKKSEKGNSGLISSVPEIYADSVAGQVLGWISTDMLQKKGARLHGKLYPSPVDAPSLKYVPVLSMKHQQDSTVLQVYRSIPVIDRSANFILNTKGGRITYPRYEQLQTDLKKINIVFAVEGQKEMQAEFPGMVNVIQNLVQTLRENPDGFGYRIGVCTPFRKNGNQTESPFVVQPCTDYISFMDSLSEVALHINNFSVQEEQVWSTLHKSVDMLEKYKNETNIIVFVGTKGYGGESPSLSLAKKTAGNNCRILAFQLYAGEKFTYDNFVLQMKNLITLSADSISEKKKEMLVSAVHLREKNSWRQGHKNIYSLDFPDASMSQGWLLFPEKEKKMTWDKLSFSTDTLISQIKQDNSMLLHELDKAFMSMGNSKTIFSSAAASYLNIRNDNLPASLLNCFAYSSPLLFIPGQFRYSSGNMPEYFLLLNKEEMDNLRSFMEGLSSFEVDYVEEASFYLPTGKIRKQLCRYLFRKVNENRLCGMSKKRVGEMKLADILSVITGCPASLSFPVNPTLEELKKKWVVTDELLDAMLQYIASKKRLLDTGYKKESFISNGQSYYWLRCDMLP